MQWSILELSLPYSLIIDVVLPVPLTTDFCSWSQIYSLAEMGAQLFANRYLYGYSDCHNAAAQSSNCNAQCEQWFNTITVCLLCLAIASCWSSILLNSCVACYRHWNVHPHRLFVRFQINSVTARLQKECPGYNINRRASSEDAGLSVDTRAVIGGVAQWEYE